MSLEEAQSSVLYHAVCEAGGLEITEPDGSTGLVEPS
jgi:hypothetical protein